MRITDFCSPAVDNGDVTVEGTNGFGNLLAEDISQGGGIAALAKATAVYGYHAKTYFG